jgi:hypothetical protein
MGATLAAGTTTVPGTLCAYLTTVGVAGGWRCLELGGGNGSIAEWLAAKAGCFRKCDGVRKPLYAGVAAADG